MEKHDFMSQHVCFHTDRKCQSFMSDLCSNLTFPVLQYTLTYRTKCLQIFLLLYLIVIKLGMSRIRSSVYDRRSLVLEKHRRCLCHFIKKLHLICVDTNQKTFHFFISSRYAACE